MGLCEAACLQPCTQHQLHLLQSITRAKLSWYTCIYLNVCDWSRDHLTHLEEGFKSSIGEAGRVPYKSALHLTHVRAESKDHATVRREPPRVHSFIGQLLKRHVHDEENGDM